MTEMTKYAPGTFCWVDYVAHDMEAAQRWYAELFGWEAQTQETQGGPPYAMFTNGGKVVAGIGQMSDEMKKAGVPPMWNNYVSVDDAAAVAEQAKALGATVTVPAMKVMDAGSLAFFMDPAGAAFAVWQPGNHHGSQIVNEAVSLSWNELAVRDVAKAQEFYGKLFGWSFSSIPMGEFDYTVIKNGDRDNGGIMPMQGPKWEGVPPHWMAYFAVEDCDATAKLAEASGGAIMVPGTDIPAGRFAVLRDAQGGVFTAIQLNNPG